MSVVMVNAMRPGLSWVLFLNKGKHEACNAAQKLPRSLGLQTSVIIADGENCGTSPALHTNKT